ncbi:MAG: DUF58 domain-containing protein [Clostridiales bacterium]|jgi:hypothetical protein|nr:DUF58 domain-containing protein [Clostridiales bacterium]
MTIFVILLLIVFYVAQRRSKDRALDGLEFDSQCSKGLLEPGEVFELILKVTNRSYRFMPFIKIEQMLPNNVICHTEGVVIENVLGNLRHISSLYMMPKSRITRRLRVSINDRGRYVFSGIKAHGGDFLGINETKRFIPFHNEVVVYPRLLNTPDVMAVLGGFIGDISVRRFIIEDPVLTVGVREYTGKEPMKSISWNHSARMGSLMVKQFDYTIDPAVSLIVDVENGGEEGSRELIERVYSLTRTVCQTLEGKGMKYDILTNAVLSDGFARWSYLNEGIGMRHYSTVLEGLGRGTYSYVEKLSAILDTMAKSKEQSRAVILISIKNDPYREENIRCMEMKTGGRVYCMFADSNV